ncbi:hypothetical protein STREPTOSP366_55190, partial [Streptomyces variabilis]
MAAEQLPDGVREFTDHLRGLLARLDRYAGWCVVFWQRDPEGMRACLEGQEPPPWDVVESLLQDLAAVHGPAAAEAELPRARSLHAEATAAFDARPGARQTLGDHLDVMLREQRYAADRRDGLTRRLAAAANHEEAEALGNDLAWAEDDHRRATARCAELTARMTALDDRTRATSPAHTQGRFATRRTPDAASSESRGAQSAPADRGRPSSPAPPSPVQGHGPTPSDRGHGSSSAAPARDSAPIRGGQALSSAGDGGGPASPGSGRGPTPADPSHRLPTPGSPHPHPASHAADRHTTAPPEAHPSPHAARQASDPRPHGHPPPPGAVPPELRAAQQHVPPPAPAEEARPAPSRKRRRGGARFAGVEDDGATPLVEPTAAVPELP